MDLFSPIKVGSYTIKNRVFMAPMTRCRAVDNNTPNALMREYYAQRAGAGLIITEATPITPQGIGYPCTPGIYTKEQIKGWKNITDAVHEKGGHIFLQLWHVGRISHSSYHNGTPPVAPSAIKPSGQIYTYAGMQDYETPHALSIQEIQETTKIFVEAAKNAMEAGFDGVEVHGANGYLLDQFLRDGTNKREDIYGGSIENRARFLLEVVEAVSGAVGADKTGVRLSPSGTMNEMSDTNPKEDFAYVADKLNSYNLAYLHVVDALSGDIKHGAKVVELSVLRDAYKGVLITCGEYDKVRGMQAIEENLADAVAYGKPFISNPDLVERLLNDAKLTEPDSTTFYTQDAKGYTDYPAL